jgi:hypothetical protein
LTAGYVPVSKKRWLLAIYLDLVVFSAAWGLILHFLAPGREFTLLRYLVFGLLEAMLLGLVRWSPGEYLLSISFLCRADDPVVPEGAEPLEAGRKPVVDRRVWSNEAALTILLGVLYVVDGAKSVVRWTMWSPPQPVFGVQLGTAGGAAIAVAEGILYLFVGGLVLRLHRWAPPAVAATSALLLASAAFSWRLWDDYVLRYVEARRAYQGVAVRPGEVAFMQALTPEGAMALAVLAVIVVVAYRKRFGSVRPTVGVRA